MNVFAETSGLFALLVKSDYTCIREMDNFNYFVKNNSENNAQLVTSLFVLLVETTVFLQRRTVLIPY
jgi:hypothetical protein